MRKCDVPDLFGHGQRVKQKTETGDHALDNHSLRWLIAILEVLMMFEFKLRNTRDVLFSCLISGSYDNDEKQFVYVHTDNIDILRTSIISLTKLEKWETSVSCKLTPCNFQDSVHFWPLPVKLWEFYINAWRWHLHRHDIKNAQRTRRCDYVLQLL